MRHFADRAGFVAALPEEDPERRAAVEHAATCAACRHALDEGSKLVSYLEALSPPVAPSAETLARVTAAIGEELDRERGSAKRGLTVSTAISVILVWSLLVLSARHRDASAWLVSAALVLATALVSLIATARKRPLGALLVLSGASVTFAIWAGQLSGFEFALGVKCTLTELLASVGPLAVAYIGARRGGPWNATYVAAMAAGGALVGHSALHLTCPANHHEPHLLAFHAGGVVLAAAIGALASRWRPAAAAAP